MSSSSDTIAPNAKASSEDAMLPAHGHIGLVVLGSIAGGLGAGAVLDLLVFGGSSETVITGMALVSLAFGFALLTVLSSWRTSQPQSWAIHPAVWFGVVGGAITLTDPSSHALDLASWVWPALLLVLVVWTARAARRSLRNWSRLALIYPALTLLALLAVGGAYETVAEATTSNSVPKSGRLYAVNGHSLYMGCSGRGNPTVILFNGLGERASSWARVQPNVSGTTRVCTFDRAGEGWSGVASGRQDGRQLAADLHALLAVARVPGPYVLAGHSVGGTYALVYAHEFPSQVAGVALVDSATPYQFDLPAYPGFYSTWRRVSGLFPTIARAGFTRALGLGSPREVRADHSEFTELPTTFKQAQALATLGSKPLVVLTAGLGQQAGWSAAQDKLALLSSSHAHRTIRGATHAALLDDHYFARITSMGIKAVVIAARRGVSLGERTGA
jgi:pimeloyl-ACP methyl ester carboxylesterase